MPPKLLLDCDGVLYDLIRRTQKDPRMEGIQLDTSNYDLLANLSPSNRQVVLDIWGSPGFAYYMPLTSFGSQMLIRNMHNLSSLYDIEIVTKPFDSPSWKADRLLSIEKDFGFPVHFADNKSDFKGDVFVEDNLSNLFSWMERNPNGIGLFVKSNYSFKQILDALGIPVSVMYSQKNYRLWDSFCLYSNTRYSLFSVLSGHERFSNPPKVKLNYKVDIRNFRICCLSQLHTFLIDLASPLKERKDRISCQELGTSMEAVQSLT